MGVTGLEGVQPGEQVRVTVEEGAVHSGGACDGRHADLPAVCRGAVESGDDALPAAG